MVARVPVADGSTPRSKKRVTPAPGDGYVRVVYWYDNEWGYSNRYVDLIERLGAV